jgi:hypothetical protein
MDQWHYLEEGGALRDAGTWAERRAGTQAPVGVELPTVKRVIQAPPYPAKAPVCSSWSAGYCFTISTRRLRVRPSSLSFEVTGA